MNNIKTLRVEKGINQSELAKYLNVAQGTLSYWEQGKYDIDNASLKKIADYFDVTIDYILGYSDIKKASEQTEDDITMENIKYALYGEYRELSESDKQQLINLAKIARSLKEEGK